MAAGPRRGRSSWAMLAPWVCWTKAGCPRKSERKEQRFVQHVACQETVHCIRKCYCMHGTDRSIYIYINYTFLLPPNLGKYFDKQGRSRFVGDKDKLQASQ